MYFHKPYDVDRIYLARDIIEKDLTKHFTIEELAREVGTNERKLKIGFRQEFGVGPYEMLSKKRIQAATALLQGTNLPVKEIARRTGYRHPSSFVEAFRKRFLVSPARWRRKVLTGFPAYTQKVPIA